MRLNLRKEWFEREVPDEEVASVAAGVRGIDSLIAEASSHREALRRSESPSLDVFEGCADAIFSEVGRLWGASDEALARARFDAMPTDLVESVSKLILAGMTLGNRAARKALEER